MSSRFVEFPTSHDISIVYYLVIFRGLGFADHDNVG